jgi:hypothetical protein
MNSQAFSMFWARLMGDFLAVLMAVPSNVSFVVHPEGDRHCRVGLSLLNDLLFHFHFLMRRPISLLPLASVMAILSD